MSLRLQMAASSIERCRCIIVYCRVSSGVRRDCVIRNLWWSFPVPIWDDRHWCERYIQQFIYKNMYNIEFQRSSLSACPFARVPSGRMTSAGRVSITGHVSCQSLFLARCQRALYQAGRLTVLLCYVTSGVLTTSHPVVQFGPAPNKNNKKIKQ